jgi:hypothetical protein
MVFSKSFLESVKFLRLLHQSINFIVEFQINSDIMTKFQYIRFKKYDILTWFYNFIDWYRV